MAVRVPQKGWIVIPADLRKKYDLSPGTEVDVVDYDGVWAVVPRLTRPVDEAAGMFAGRGSLTRALLAERRPSGGERNGVAADRPV
jgi:AbrB family looped-hinge helix DNA binding protein